MPTVAGRSSYRYGALTLLSGPASPPSCLGHSTAWRFLARVDRFRTAGVAAPPYIAPRVLIGKCPFLGSAEGDARTHRTLDLFGFGQSQHTAPVRVEDILHEPALFVLT